MAGVQNALTYGGDAFKDRVSVVDPRGNSDTTTPSGERTVSGAFVQLKSNYSTWLETIAAARYDNYRLDGLGTTAGGERLSPKFTIGITPFDGFTPYGSYSEGYRAPSITETIISGAHASAGGPAPRNCADGNSGYFCFLPNPNLRPEVGKNKEIGVNLRYDNIWRDGDSFRGKFNVYQNDVYDYIDLVAFGVDANNAAYGPPFYQYQNIPHARLRGFEYETMYDAGAWFAGVSGHVMEGKNVDTGVSLYTVQPRKVVTTIGARFFERKLTASVRWASIEASQDNLPAGYVAGSKYELVNLYLGYAPTPDVLASFTVENLLDQYYRAYAVPGSTALETQNDTLWAAPGSGITFKGGLKVRFGALQ
jgi:hemoglobin/transferrin/lactoferrin receptor protein